MEVNSSIASAIARTYTRQIGAVPVQGGSAGSLRQSGTRPRTDSLSLSYTTQELLRVRDIASAQPETRFDRILALKKAVANGTYEPNLTSIAGKLLG
jgi:flagellar biosynthesis anti-sigma factor FlgM